MKLFKTLITFMVSSSLALPVGLAQNPFMPAEPVKPKSALTYLKEKKGSAIQFLIKNEGKTLAEMWQAKKHLLPQAQRTDYEKLLKPYMDSKLPKVERKGETLIFHGDDKKFIMDFTHFFEGSIKVNGQIIWHDDASNVQYLFQKLKKSNQQSVSLFEMLLLPRAEAINWMNLVGFLALGVGVTYALESWFDVDLGMGWNSGAGAN